MLKSPDERMMSLSSRRVYEVLKSYVSLAWPIFKAQCELIGRDPCRLEPDDLPEVVPRIAEALARFTSAAKAEAFRRRILGATSMGDPIEAAIVSQRMDPRTSNNPVVHNDLALKAVATLEEFTPLARAVFEAQCARSNVDPAALTPDQLEGIAPDIARAAARFTSPRKGEAAGVRLIVLAKEHR